MMQPSGGAQILAKLLPVFLLIALGAALRRTRFLSEPVADIFRTAGCFLGAFILQSPSRRE